MLVFSLLFVLTGIGNGSVYKMIPAVFHAEAATRLGAVPTRRGRRPRRVGSPARWSASPGPSGRWAVCSSSWPSGSPSSPRGRDSRVRGFLGFYAVCAAVTWAVYLRPSRDRLVDV